MSDEPTDAAPGAGATDDDTVGGGSGSLRSAAFLCTVIAGLLVGLGALLTWVTFGLNDPNAAVLDQVYKGIDLSEGLVALGCAAVLLVGTMVFRGLARPGRTAVAVLMIVAGIVAVGSAGATILTAGTRLETQFVDELVAASPGKGSSGVDDATRQQLEDMVETSLGAGIWLTLAGGFLGFVGGTLSLAYATRLTEDDEGAIAAI
ncbi:MAG: Trp biosynthesis-associated membrane protein [Actinomycetota bacterium]